MFFLVDETRKFHKYHIFNFFARLAKFARIAMIFSRKVILGRQTILTKNYDRRLNVNLIEIHMLRMTGSHLEWLKMSVRGKMRELVEGIRVHGTGVGSWVFSGKHIWSLGGGGVAGEKKRRIGVEFGGDGGLRS
jgi:hypothetical protein